MKNFSIQVKASFSHKASENDVKNVELVSSKDSAVEETRTIGGHNFTGIMAKLYDIAQNHEEVDVINVISDNFFTCFIDCHNTNVRYSPETDEIEVESVTGEEYSEKVDEKDLKGWFDEIVETISDGYNNPSHFDDADCDVPKGPYVVLNAGYSNGLLRYTNCVLFDDLETAILDFEKKYRTAWDHDHLYKGTRVRNVNCIKSVSFEDDTVEYEGAFFAVISLDDLLKALNKNVDVEHYDKSLLDADVDCLFEDYIV